jgi:acetylglutamate kinase
VKVLIKLGGTLLDNEESRRDIARQIAALPAQGVQAVVVHGGGKQMTRFLAERGVQSEFVNGLRVTTPEVVDALLKVFAGSVNKDLTATLNGTGARAVGLSGIDAGLAKAVQLNPELGAVGRIESIDATLLDLLVREGFLPVVACVAGGRNGEVFNVNADQMAVACAAAYGAQSLLFLTDVDGVRGAAGETLRHLTISGAKALIEGGVARGGMQAKLESAAAALLDGVGEVVIAPGAAADVVARLLAGESLGTRIERGQHDTSQS